MSKHALTALGNDDDDDDAHEHLAAIAEQRVGDRRRGERRARERRDRHRAMNATLISR